MRMEEKKYTLTTLVDYNKTYNEMIAFLKKTLPKDCNSEMLNKFEQLAFEDDYRGSGLKKMLNLNGFVTMASLVASMFGVDGIAGVALASGPFTFMYYLWYKTVMKISKSNKEECLSYIQQLSESQNNIKYPFEIGEDQCLRKMKEFLKTVKGIKTEEIENFFSQYNLEDSNIR